MKIQIGGSKESKSFSPKQESTPVELNAGDYAPSHNTTPNNWLGEWKEEATQNMVSRDPGHSHSHFVNTNNSNIGNITPIYNPPSNPNMNITPPQPGVTVGGVGTSPGNVGIVGTGGLQMGLTEEQMDALADRVIDRLRPLLREVYNEGFQDGLDA